MYVEYDVPEVDADITTMMEVSLFRGKEMLIVQLALLRPNGRAISDWISWHFQLLKF